MNEFLTPLIEKAANVSSSTWLMVLSGIATAAILLLLAVGKVPLGYNLRNLLVRWLTTLLTALAFTVVVGLLTVMLAFVKGMYRMTEGSSQPGNVVVLSDGATDELFSDLGYSDTSDLERQPGVLTNSQGERLCSREVYRVVNQPLPTSAGAQQRRRFTQLRGLEEPAISGQVHSIELQPGGTWFGSAGVREVPDPQGGEKPIQAIEAVLGAGVAGQLGGDVGRPTLAPGDLFPLSGRTWVVAGVMQPDGSTFGSEIWAKRSVVGQLLGKETLSTVVLRTRDAEAAGQLAEHLENEFKKSAVQAETEREYFAKLSQTNWQFLVAIVIVSVIMAIGGMFGVMNTMFAAIGQRIKDIGVLRLMGFTPRQVLVSFLLESLAIALLGGLLGCALGALTNGVTASSIVSGGQGGAKFVVVELVVDADVIAAGLLFTLLMGFAGGLIPALSAMRLRPLECLR